MKGTFRFTTSITLLAIFAVFIYLSSERLGYTWHIEKIPQYFVNKSEVGIRAPFDGTIKFVDSTQVVIESEADGSEQRIFADEIDADLVSGEFIEEDDIVGFDERWGTGPLLNGLACTIIICLIACTAGFFIAIPLAIFRNSDGLIGQTTTLLFIELVRGTPLLVQLFIIYFLFGTFWNMNNFTAGAIGLTVFASVYYAEIIRSGLNSLSSGQAEVARTLGLGKWQTFRHVLLPQAIQKSVPSLVGQTVSIVKDSSLLSVIAVAELTKNAREVVATSFASFEVWLTVALMYLLLCAVVGAIGRKLEARYA